MITFTLLILLPLLTHAFPDHLLGTVGCVTELATDEVIMNSPVVAFEDSKSPEIQVRVKTDEGELLQSPLVIDKVPAVYNIVVVNPNQVADVQFVMDTTEGATFEHGQCDRKQRVTGKCNGDESNFSKLVVETMPSKPIQVWAGWATGHSEVTLTNKFVLQAGSTTAAVEAAAADTTATDKDSADLDVAKIVDAVKAMEKAEEKERQDVQQELADDDQTTAGDLAQQLEKVHADEEAKKKMERLMEMRHEFKQRAAHHKHGRDYGRYKEMLKEKPGAAEFAKRLNMMDPLQWEKVKEQLIKKEKFTDRLDHQKQLERELGRGPIDSNKLKDLSGRDNRWKERLINKREMIKKMKSRAPPPKDEEEGEIPEEEVAQEDEEENGDETVEGYTKRRVREIYEEQESDIAIKQFLFGLLFVLMANWVVIQICLYKEKKNKAKRSL